MLDLIIQWFVEHPRNILKVAGIVTMGFSALFRKPLPFFLGALAIFLGVIDW